MVKSYSISSTRVGCRAMASTRHLAPILAADVAGYSRLMGADEEGTLVRDPLTRFSSSVRWVREELAMIEDSSASRAGPTEIREMCRGWAAPSRRGLMGLGVGLVAGAAAQLLAGEAAAAGATETFDQLKRAERDPNHRVLLKGGMVVSLDPGVGDFEKGDVLI